MGFARLSLVPKWIDADPPHGEPKALFSCKDAIPFAWCLLFRRDDHHFTRGALVSDFAAALERGRLRINLLRPHATAQLTRLLERFLELLAKEAAPLDLTIDDWEITGSPFRAVEWCDSLDGEPVTHALLERGQELFPDGLDWGVGGELRLDVDSAELTTGWAANVADRAALLDVVAPEARPLQRTRSPELDELDRVYEQPLDLAPRLVCADRLSALGDPRGEFILLQCSANTLTSKQSRRLRRLWHELEPELTAPFAPARVTFENGFASTASFATPPTAPMANPQIWKTVHTLELRGGADALRDPAFQNVRRLAITGDDVLRIVELRIPLPVTSIRLSGNGANAAWRSLGLREWFPSLLEVHIESASVWLSEGAKLLVEARPEVNLRSGPLIHVTQLAPLTQEEQLVRRAKWDKPFGSAQLVGARFDDRYV